MIMHSKNESLIFIPVSFGYDTVNANVDVFTVSLHLTDFSGK